MKYEPTNRKLEHRHMMNFGCDSVEEGLRQYLQVFENAYKQTEDMIIAYIYELKMFDAWAEKSQYSKFLGKNEKI